MPPMRPRDAGRNLKKLQNGRTPLKDGKYVGNLSRANQVIVNKEMYTLRGF